MNELFDQFGGLMSIMIAAVIGVATYFLAGRNTIYAVVAGLIALVVINVVGKNTAEV